jgi:hypothetical protein
MNDKGRYRQQHAIAIPKRSPRVQNAYVRGEFTGVALKSIRLRGGRGIVDVNVLYRS